MSLENLTRERLYVLGPLELSPGHIAVGEISYAAIKGKMPYYNSLRQKYYTDGHKEVADAIGELETRAVAAEKWLAKMTESKNKAKEKIKLLLAEMEAMKEAHEDEIKRLRRSKNKPLEDITEEKKDADA